MCCPDRHTVVRYHADRIDHVSDGRRLSALLTSGGSDVLHPRRELRLNVANYALRATRRQAVRAAFLAAF
jgi:hypothetical protein